MSLSNSPFTNRLDTNYVPSPSEILEIRSLLVDPLEEIARIDAQIEEMELALTELREKRALLQQPIDAHKALISPMRLIPHDVLLEIFFACLPSEHNALIDPAEAPLLLGRICRHWRSVAYSAPMLWSSIHIPPLDYSNTPPGILLGLERTVKAWLERSAACPLSVSFFDFTNYVEPDSEFEKHLFAPQVLAASRRLRCLVLFGDAEFLRPILQLGPENLPLLKSIRMKTLIQTFSTKILEIPTLEDVALSLTVATDQLSLPLPWSQLRRLRLDCQPRWTGQGYEGGLDFDGAINVLRMSPNLEHCEMRVTKYSEYSSYNSSPIFLPLLHTLVFSGWQFYLRNWIPDLVAPNLYSLQIGDVIPPPDNQGRLSVAIDFHLFTTTSLHEFLQSLPMISSLQLVAGYHAEGVPPDDEFIALLCPPHNSCPMLTDIGIMMAPSTGISDAAILAFIKARMAMPTPLRRFEASFSRRMELDVMPDLQCFISGGLQVTLKYPQSRRAFRARDGLDGPGAFY
ncbi:hypothetical protein MSAN_01881800 [Mycena sanguinolenta]|uniref:F-box domain-containing protein n=1 Tax=Mycena sanguinolenta TaxID=230812 RepID=A0A8H6XUB1_9AGAR|nr:hypothetical protein MSAN_01881800 [Mycena sanguinolenta]